MAYGVSQNTATCARMGAAGPKLVPRTITRVVISKGPPSLGTAQSSTNAGLDGPVVAVTRPPDLDQLERRRVCNISRVNDPFTYYVLLPRAFDV